MPSYIPNAYIHQAIRKQIELGTPLSAAHWNHNPTPISPGHTLDAAYTMAKIRKVHGKPFFGHGTWYAYLQHVHGVSPTAPIHLPNERLVRVIEVTLQNGIGGKAVPTASSKWQLESDIQAHTGHTLSALYQLVQRRNINGRNFLGHGSWRAFVTSLHKPKPPHP